MSDDAGSVMAAASRRWLMNSGIRVAGGASAGALYRQYDAGRASYAAFYPEVSGYLAQLHTRLARDASDEDGRAAIETGQWLCRVQTAVTSTHSGAFSHAIVDAGPTGGWYAFDTAIVVHALLDLARLTGDENFARHARRGGEWLLSMQRPDGSFESVAGAPAIVTWAGTGGCLHGKHVLALGALHAATGEARYAESARRLLDWLLSLQNPDGSIDALAGAGYTIVHTQCYAIEGLIGGHTLFGYPGALEAAARAGSHLAAIQRADGGMPRYSGAQAAIYLRDSGSRFPWVRERYVPADAGCTAQAARIWQWLQRLAGTDHAPSIARGLDWLAGQQLHSADPTLDGGMPAGVDRLFGLRRRELRLYPWVSIFAIDAERIRHLPDAPADLF